MNIDIYVSKRRSDLALSVPSGVPLEVAVDALKLRPELRDIRLYRRGVSLDAPAPAYLDGVAVRHSIDEHGYAQHSLSRRFLASGSGDIQPGTQARRQTIRVDWLEPTFWGSSQERPVQPDLAPEDALIFL